jgi:hypothetical protein
MRSLAPDFHARELPERFSAQIVKTVERVGFAPLPVVENKELNALSLPHDPLDPQESAGRDTY